jgi:hypothetical protein
VMLRRELGTAERARESLDRGEDQTVTPSAELKRDASSTMWRTAWSPGRPMDWGLTTVEAGDNHRELVAARRPVRLWRGSVLLQLPPRLSPALSTVYRGLLGLCKQPPAEQPPSGVRRRIHRASDLFATIQTSPAVGLGCWHPPRLSSCSSCR